MEFMDILFKRSKGMKISLDKNQRNQLSSEDDINMACKLDGVVAYDIYYNNNLVGFALLRNYGLSKWFLWNYAIDKNYQGKGLGEEALKKLIKLMEKEYGMTEISTTYIFGNDIAKNLYSKLGFIETDVVDEENCHEVNMLLKLN